MQTRFTAALIGLVTLFANASLFAQEPIPQEHIDTNPYCTDPFCICIIAELMSWPNGYSYYIGERHNEYCSEGMDCGDSYAVTMVLQSGITPDDCETTGCSYGQYPVAQNRLNKPLLPLIAKKVKHDFLPKFSPKYPGDIEIIHSEFISFVVDGQQRRAKTFLIKVQPTDISEKNPVRVVGLGFEVEENELTKPVLAVSSEKNTTRLHHSVYQVNMRGMIYGIATTDAPPKPVASSPTQSPTLAVKE